MVFTDLICKPLQKKVFQATGTPLPINSFAPRVTPGDHTREDGIRYVNDITYAEEYPNSHLDIWYCPKEGIHPTVMHWHGGGFIFGDKIAGDPLATKPEDDANLLLELVRRGYNVVNVNYALAPEYRYPVQLRQMNQAIAYCLRYSRELSLDMDRVFLMGGSAGAIMTEIYGMAMVNADYAARLGFTAALPESKLCGLIIDEAPTDYRNYNSFRMDVMINTFMGTNNLKRCKNAETADVPRFIRDKYPPCFITACNLEHFFKDAAEQLTAKLDEIGVEYEYFYVPKEIEGLEHGFLQRFASSKSAGECFERMLAFMARRLETV